jgi:import inner membrane translocase subunit TIM54
MIKGRGHGDIARRIAEEVKSRRRVALGLDTPTVPTLPVPTYMSPEETRKYELKGGVVIIGRHTFKEFMAGLKRGWTDSLERVDADEVLARELEDDGHFDEPDLPPEEANFGDGEKGHVGPSSHFPSAKSSPVYSPLQTIPQSRPQPTRKTDSISPSMDALPSAIPNLPPLLLVPFTNFIGFTQIPYMIWDFFNQRHKCRAGAEAAYRLIKNETRPIEAATYATDLSQTSATKTHSLDVPHNDLDFDRNAESYFKRSFASTPADIEKARQKYYDALPAKLETARSLLRGIREMTKEENLHPPPTEVELRAERMEKEKRWRNDLEGWAIVNPDQEVTWDERFRESLRVFVEPSS